MNNTNYLIFLLLLFITGCSKHPEPFEPNLTIADSLFTKDPGFSEIDLSLSTIGVSIQIEDIARNVSFMPLESRVEAFAKRISNLVVEDTLVILNTRESILYFNSRGEYLSTFENQGHGPEEYTTIYGFAVDIDSNQMAIADARFVKLFDLWGNFIKLLELPGPPFSLTPSIAYLNSEHLLIENDRILPAYQEGYHPLWSLNLQTENYFRLFRNYPDSIYQFQRKYSFIGQLMPADNTIYYHKSVDSENVYAVDQNHNVTLQYRLHFGDRTMPPGAKYNSDRYNEYSDQFVTVYNIFETERYRFVKYAIGYPETVMSYAVYDKQEYKVISHQSDSEGMTSEAYPGLTFWPSYVNKQGQLICVHPAGDFSNGEILQGIKNDDNVVLSVITLK